MENKTKNNETDRPDGGYGWVIVASIILINASLLVLINSFGIIFHDEFKEQGISSVATTFMLHLQNFLNCCFGFFSGPFLKTFGYRPVAFIGSILICTGVFLTSFGNSYGFLIFSVSILTGIGQGIAMPATYLATYTYFKKRLTIAISLTVTGASLTNAVMPKICDKLLSTIGRKYTVLILAALSLSSLIGCALLKPLKKKNTEEPLEEKPLNVEKNDDNTIYKSTTISRQHTSCLGRIKLVISEQFKRIIDVFDLQLLANIKIMIIIIGLGLSFAVELNLIVMHQFILGELCSFNRSQVAIASSILFATDIFGRLVVPLGAHLLKIQPKVMYCGALILATIARTLLDIFYSSHYVIYVICAVIGLTKGVRAVFQSVIIPKYVALEKLPTANGMNSLLTGILSLIVGTSLGYIHDKSGSFKYTLLVGSVISCSCVVLWIIEAIFLKKSQKQDQNINENS